MPSARALQVLLVDDQVSMRNLARHCLKQLEIDKVNDVPDGARALKELNSRPYDLVLSDWNMEGIDGLELLKTIRANPALKKTPFIMMTGQADKEKVRLAIEAGVNNYVVKPFNVATLKKKIEAVVGKLT